MPTTDPTSGEVVPYTPERWERMCKAWEMHRDGLALRDIAKVVGVHHSQVARDLEGYQAAVRLPHVRVQRDALLESFRQAQQVLQRIVVNEKTGQQVRVMALTELRLTLAEAGKLLGVYPDTKAKVDLSLTGEVKLTTVTEAERALDRLIRETTGGTQEPEEPSA